MDEHLPDAIDKFLDQGTGSDAGDDLRRSVLQRTTRLLRRRRWLRRTGIAAGLCGCYAAGILTMWLASTPPSPGRAGSVSDRGARGEEAAVSAAPGVRGAPGPSAPGG